MSCGWVVVCRVGCGGWGWERARYFRISDDIYCGMALFRRGVPKIEIEIEIDIELPSLRFSSYRLNDRPPKSITKAVSRKMNR